LSLQVVDLVLDNVNAPVAFLLFQRFGTDETEQPITTAASQKKFSTLAQHLSDTPAGFE
jgi:hypothetical protein